MSNQPKAHFNSMGNDFQISFGLDMLSGRAKASLLRALLEQTGVLPEVTKGGEAEAILNKAVNNLWEQK
jgi:hypothetical protein